MVIFPVLPARFFSYARLCSPGVAVAALFFSLSYLPGQVLNGIDNLVLSSFKPLEGLRVGLITNHSGRDKNGESTIDLLHASNKLKLVKLFSPEHGIRGTADGKVGDSIDRKTGLKIHSLYGEIRKPKPTLLQGIDALVFDIQDIGCRFYTYISTMGNCMEAARSAKLKFVVLDRINPIGGTLVEGPILSGKRSFTGYHEIPVRHGMTVGELARLFVLERFSGLDLTVVPVRNWKRDQMLTGTGLPWVNPSPNIRNLNAAILYPGVGLLEFTNLSVGRGTATPFELVGAPYIDSTRFSLALNRFNLPDLEFIPATFTPNSSLFKGSICGGVRIVLRNQNANTVDLGIVIGLTLRKLYPDKWLPTNLDKLLVHPPTAKAILMEKSLGEIKSLWLSDLAAFTKRRSRALIY